jgi:hypothetical protein
MEIDLSVIQEFLFSISNKYKFYLYDIGYQSNLPGKSFKGKKYDNNDIIGIKIKKKSIYLIHKNKKKKLFEDVDEKYLIPFILSNSDFKFYSKNPDKKNDKN